MFFDDDEDEIENEPKSEKYSDFLLLYEQYFNYKGSNFDRMKDRINRAYAHNSKDEKREITSILISRNMVHEDVKFLTELVNGRITVL